MWISSELAGELSTLRYPICFMDFETLFPALPRFAGMRPYDHIPFQWSVHRHDEPGLPIEHYEFVADDNSDPRPRFIESLCRAIRGAGNIVVYNQSFESSRLDDLAQWLPEYRTDVAGIQSKLWDLLPVVRRNVYHPAFKGSFSLKNILPALIPELNHSNLEISDGGQAGLAWMELVNPATSDEHKARLKCMLLEYCGLDTLSLANLFALLKKITDTAA
jgi:Domain of unknown function(DUF2779)